METTTLMHDLSPTMYIDLEDQPLTEPPAKPKDDLPAPYNVVAELQTIGTSNAPDTRLTIWATVLIPQNGPQCYCIQTFTLDPDGNIRLQFHICYSECITCDTDAVFQKKQYVINVEQTTLPPSFKLSDVTSVEVFLWDKDPKTSRGTVTTVTHSSTGSER